MSSSESYLQFLNIIYHSNKEITEAPLLEVENIPFKKDEINLSDYLDKYNSLLSINEMLYFNDTKFSEITENNLVVLKNLYNSNSSINQKRLSILFILLTVINTQKYCTIFDSEDQKYDLLFDPFLLPKNPNEKCSNSLIHYINEFLYHEYCSNPNEIVQKINSYYKQQNDNNCIYNFLPFFIKILQKENPKQIEHFINSLLFDQILEISQKDILIFDYCRHIIFQYPEIAFQRVIVTQNMPQMFFDEIRNQSIVYIFEKAIEKHTVHSEILNEILVVFSFIILHAHEHGKEKSKFVFGLLFCIDTFFNIISPEIDLSSFFKSVATYAVYSEVESSFEISIDTVRKLIIQRPSFIFQLKNQTKFFNILNECKKRINYNYLINLATIYEGKMIHLYQIIMVLTSLIQYNSEDEEKIVNDLLNLSQNEGNLIELDHAKVPNFILKRLPIIQENESVCQKYLKLYANITEKIFHKTTFLCTIDLLKNQEFKYSSSILDILNNHLGNFLKNNFIENNNYLAFQYRKDQFNLHNEPFSFYRFDNYTGCGIFCPKINLLSFSLTFCFWMRINEIENTKKTPLIYFDNEKCKLDFYFQNNKVFLDTANETFELNGYPEIEKGKWYFYCFSIEKGIIHWNLTLNLYDNKNVSYTSNKIKFLINANEFNLYVCQKPILSKKQYDYPSLICDMSLFVLIGDHIDHLTIKQKLIDFVSSNDLNMNYFPHLLCLLNPSQSHDNVCFNVNKNLSKVSYSGKIIPVIPNFYDIIQNIESIQTFLPLISNLENDINNEDGIEKLHLILSIFCKTISICEDSFFKSRFFELLVSFIYDCESLIQREALKDFLEMYLKIKNPELKKSFLTSVYLNYKFLSNLHSSVDSFFYSYSPLKILQATHDELKLVYDDLSSIIYTGVKYFNGIDKNSIYYWNYIKRLCLDSPNDKNIRCLIDYLKEDKTIKLEYIALNILDILHTIFEEKNEIDSSFNDLTPYIITYSQYHESYEILKLTILIIKTISKKTNKKDEIYPFIYHFMIVFKPILKMTQDKIKELNNLVLDLIVNEQMISFTSLLVILLKYSKSEMFYVQTCDLLARSEYVQNNISTIPFWTYWITKLFLHVYYQNPTEFANHCISILKNSTLLIDYIDFLDICCGLLQNQNKNFDAKEFFISVKEYLLIHLFNNKKIDYSSIYNFLLFQIDVVPKESQINLSCFDEFVQELFNDFDINVSLRTKVNENFLKFILSKTQSLLSKLVSNKIQLCGTKVEVAIKDVNAYLSNLQGNVANEEFTSLLTNCLDSYKEIVEQKYKPNLKWNKDLEDTLKFEREYTQSEDEPIEYKLLFVFDSKKFDFYYNEKHDFISELETKYKIENNFLSRMKKSFMDSISLLPGPWESLDNNKEIKRFKLLNRISKSGKKILMRINKKFNDHSDASSNRLQGHHLNDIDTLVYKTLETAPEQSKKLNFKTKVIILSQSKDEEVFLEACENYIALSTESSNKFIYWDEIEFIMNRKEAYFENSCEIFKNNGRSYFIQFVECERKYFYSFIDKLKLNFHDDKKYGDILKLNFHDDKKCGDKFDFFNSLRISCNGIYQTKKIQTIIQDIDLTNLWKKRKITTFSYIYYLNLLCGRSYNDIHKYIIYPCVLSDANSDEISLDKEQLYRKFDFPISAISKKMLQSSIDRYDDIMTYCDMQPYLFSEIPSSSLIISWYLIRTEPYTTIHVTKDQQNGIYPKFDNPDRLFSSVKEMINMMHSDGITKEMIPEFYDFPFFLLNENNFDLGKKANNEQVYNVELPNWSNCYYSFISTLRLMLEGKITDKLIGKWIDMIFGTKRRSFNYEGKEYFIHKYYFYPESFDPMYKEEIKQFGCLPDQIFYKENPMRDDPIDPFVLNTTIPDKSFDVKNNAHFIKNILFCPGVPKAFEIQIPNKKENQANLLMLDLKNVYGNILCYSKSLKVAIYGTKSDPFLTFYNLKTSEIKIECKVPFIITAVYLAAGRYLISGGKDCSIRVWDIAKQKNQKVVQISSSGFHTDHITSIGCCFDNGLLVSADRKQNIIFETLIDHVFINSISLQKIKRKLKELRIKEESKNTNNETSIDNENSANNETSTDYENSASIETSTDYENSASIEFSNPSNESVNLINNNDDDVEFTNLFSFASNKDDFMNDVMSFKTTSKKADLSSPLQICVFKSGIVAISCEMSVFFFDTRGKLMSVKTLANDIVEMHKCYSDDTREFLIVGAKPDKIYVFDVAYLSFIVVYDTYFSSISTFQKSLSFITYYKGKIQTFDFAQFVSRNVTKYPLPLAHQSTY